MLQPAFESTAITSLLNETSAEATEIKINQTAAIWQIALWAALIAQHRRSIDRVNPVILADAFFIPDSSKLPA